ncbi:DNA/RNA non-specific endonuclease, partial [Bifidobacterium jacchi]
PPHPHPDPNTTTQTGEDSIKERTHVNENGDESFKVDDRGHIIGDQFGGSWDLDNVIAQNGRLNEAGGAWHNMEDGWAKKISDFRDPEKGNKFKRYGEPIRDVDIRIEYDDNKRPTGFKVSWIELDDNGEEVLQSRKFRNTESGV